MSSDTLETRTGLPDALRVLLAQYPRDIWQSHHNFDGLTRFWLDRHLMFRKALAQLGDGTAQFLDANRDPRQFASQTARLAGFLLNQLHGHHQIEDHHYFPTLSGLDPRLERGFGILDADHQALDGHIHALADSTNTLLRAIEARNGARDAAAALHLGLEGFGRFLDRHLTDEEDLIVPVILHFAPEIPM